MKARTVDVLLMVGLFLVAAAILWTLFTLGNDRGRPERIGSDPEPPAASAPADPDAMGDVSSVAPGEEPPADADTPSVGPATDDPAATADATQDADAEPEDATPAVEPPSDIIEGEPVPLQRVGFSFTTGGAGACGITLEPWEHVAVSRDLLAIYGCGTEVTIELDEPVAGRSEATFVVADTMNPQFTRTANIYVDPEEPANQYGITEGVLRP